VKSREVYEVARKHERPVVIMEPVKGGMLSNPPEPVKKVFQDANPSASLASWAIKFSASLDGVITVLSGMSNLAQMEDNISYMKGFKKLSPEERLVIDKAREELGKIPLIPCTNCNYCAMVCPMNIGIPGSFTAMNYLTLYGKKPDAMHQLEWLVTGHGKENAEKCVKCARCEEACPQHIKIRDNLEKVKEAFFS